MENKEKNSKKNKTIRCNKRLFFFVIWLIICFFIAISKLIEFQIVDFEKYHRLSNVGNQVREIVPSARGDIIDRFGKVLATNDLNLSLVIGESFPFKTVGDSKETIVKKNMQGNEIILKLIKILNKHNIDWEENSPISKTKPYSFIEEKNIEVKKLKKELSQQKYASAKDAIKLLIEKYNIDVSKYNEKEIRDIAVFRANMLIKGFSEYNKTFIIINKIEPEFLDKIVGLGNKLKGIKILETSNRIYPCGEIGAHFIGNIGPLYKETYEKYKNKGYAPNAKVGKFGIEEKYEDQLKATDGILVLQKDEDENIVDRFYEKEPKAGNNVRLTIDFEFQKRLYEEFGPFIRSHNSKYASSKGGTVCVLDIKTGDVLALISHPSYDINLYNSNYEEFKKEKYSPLKDRALHEIKRPGSSFKPFILLVGLMSKTITPETRFICRDGVAPNMKCAHYGHPKAMIDVYTAIQRSCNNFFYQAGRQIGIELIDKYAPYFGFGTETGLEIYNANGRVTNPSKEFQKKYNTIYTIGSLYQTAIGQADTYTTILQQAICQMTIANRGKRYAAHIIKSIEDSHKNVIFKTKPKVISNIKIPKFAYNTLVKGMRMMAQTKACLKGMDVAAKSGSPQHSHNKNLTDAAGVGFYPSKSPEIAIATFVEDGMYAEEFFATIINTYEELKEERLNKKQKNKEL